jgi:4-hydroxy-3-methylbut-2-enyl diphosphate reductase
MRKVMIAGAQGFCTGVRRALDRVSQYQEASILGSLIHNRQVIHMLEQQGKKIVDSVTGNERHPIVITAHGTKSGEIERLRSLGLTVVDTTCPLVTSIYYRGEQLEREGYRVLIIGNRDHIEVQGIASRLSNPIIISSKEEAINTELPERVGIICQSTCLLSKFECLVQLIGERVPDMKVYNTICHPTLRRQEAARELGQKVDIMIVIGGYHSSNTRSLAELTAQYVETYHIETSNDIRNEWFIGKNIVGITAGASTPDRTIYDVKGVIAEMQ